LVSILPYGIQNVELKGHPNYAVQLKQDHRVGDWKLKGRKGLARKDVPEQWRHRIQFPVRVTLPN